VPGLILFLLPFLNGALTFIQTKVSTQLTEQSGASQQMQQMKTMNIIMPFITIWFAFIMPSALGLYWVVGIVFSIVQDLIMNRIFGKQLEAETAEFMEREHAREAELEAKRAETERLRAENATVVNKNTSKNKQRAMDKQERIEKAAEWDRAHRPKSAGETNVSASQVGDRPFARGRAYVADRFENPVAAAPAEEAEDLPETEAPAVNEPAQEPEPAAMPTAPAAEETDTEEEFDEDAPDFYGDDEDGDDDQGDAQ